MHTLNGNNPNSERDYIDKLERENCELAEQVAELKQLVEDRYVNLND